MKQFQIRPDGSKDWITIICEDDSKIFNPVQCRMEIAERYCKEKGWSTDPNELSFEQILEIRELDEWKQAGNL